MIGEQAIRPLRHKLDMFGFHLATLDIRQNSEFHDKAIGQLLAAAGVADGENYASWPEAKRMALLNPELASTRPFLHDDSASARKPTPCSIPTACWPPSARLGRPRPRRADRLDDPPAVRPARRLSARPRGGLDGTHPRRPRCPLEVVPLFETMDDLDRSPGNLAAFLEHPLTRRSRRAKFPSPAGDARLLRF